jgi:sugar phosphate permease
VPAIGDDIPSRVYERTYAKIFLRLIPFLLFCYICSYLDRINVGFAKLQMVRELGFSETAYGLGAGIFFIGYFLFEIPSNIIMLRTGPRFWIGRIMITWGLVSGAMMFVRSETAFYMLRFLLGLAEAGFIPGVLYYLNCWFPAKAKGRATALFMTGIPLSGIIGAPLSGWILHGLQGVGGLSGWQWVFLVEAVPTLLAGAACFAWLDNSPETAKWLTPGEKASIAAEHLGENADKQLHSLRDGLFNRRIWYLSLLYTMFTMGLYAISFWLPSIIGQSGVADPVSVGLLTAMPYGAALVTMWIVGRSSDRRGERRWHLSVPACLGAGGLVFSVMFSHDITMAIIGLTLATAGIITCIPQFYVIPPMLLGGSAAAAGLALINSVGNLAGFVSPFLLGYVKDATGTTAVGLLVVAACLLVGATCVLLIPKALVNK